jgi:hypothetical protein
MWNSAYFLEFSVTSVDETLAAAAGPVFTLAIEAQIDLWMDSMRTRPDERNGVPFFGSFAAIIGEPSDQLMRLSDFQLQALACANLASSFPP